VQTIKSIDPVSGLAVQHTVLSSTLREAWEAALLQDITAAVKLPLANTTAAAQAVRTAVPFKLSLHLPGTPTTATTSTTSSKVEHSAQQQQQQQQQQPSLSIEEVRLKRGTDVYTTSAAAVTRHDFVQCMHAQQQPQQSAISSSSSSPTRKLAGMLGSGKSRWAASRAALFAASSGTAAASGDEQRVVRQVSAASAAAVDATAALQAAQPMSGGLDSIFDEGAEDVRESL
jgi:hypothetical protein